MAEVVASQTREDLKDLLHQAETRIATLVAENRGLNDFCNSLMESQRFEAEQMAALVEQVHALEDALRDRDLQQQELMGLVATLRGRMGSMRERALVALQAAAENRPRQDLVKTVFDIAAESDMDELDRRIAAYNAALRPE